MMPAGNIFNDDSTKGKLTIKKMFRTFCIAIVCGLHTFPGVVDGLETARSFLVRNRLLEMPASGIEPSSFPETRRISIDAFSPGHPIRILDRTYEARPVSANSGSLVPDHYVLILDAFIA